MHVWESLPEAVRHAGASWNVFNQSVLTTGMVWTPGCRWFLYALWQWKDLITAVWAARPARKSLTMTNELSVGLREPCPPDTLSLPKPVCFTTLGTHRVTNNAEMPPTFPDCGNSPQESDEACFNCLASQQLSYNFYTWASSVFYRFNLWSSPSTYLLQNPT